MIQTHLNLEKVEKHQLMFLEEKLKLWRLGWQGSEERMKEVSLKVNLRKVIL